MSVVLVMHVIIYSGTSNTAYYFNRQRTNQHNTHLYALVFFWCLAPNPHQSFAGSVSLAVISEVLNFPPGLGARRSDFLPHFTVQSGHKGISSVLAPFVCGHVPATANGA